MIPFPHGGMVDARANAEAGARLIDELLRCPLAPLFVRGGRLTGQRNMELQRRFAIEVRPRDLILTGGKQGA
ncbi:MAG TPA: hypothetical protein VGL53_05945 [Bryobacteraceae bacterium]